MTSMASNDCSYTQLKVKRVGKVWPAGPWNALLGVEEAKANL